VLWFPWPRAAAAPIIIITITIIIIPSSHDINAIGPAPLRSGNKREHCTRVLTTSAHISSWNQILSNAPRYHSAHTRITPIIMLLLLLLLLQFTKHMHKQQPDAEQHSSVPI
jgi:hypothetical protein